MATFNHSEKNGLEGDFKGNHSNNETSEKMLDEVFAHMKTAKTPVEVSQVLALQSQLSSKTNSETAIKMTETETVKSLSQGVRDSGKFIQGGSATVQNELISSAKETLKHNSDEMWMAKKDNGLLTSPTSRPPATLDVSSSYAAVVTRPYEERLIKALTTGTDSKFTLSEEQRSNLSQKDLALIVRKITPDTATAVLVLANFTKNMTARERYLNGETLPDGSSAGIGQEQIKDHKLKDAYSDANVIAIGKQVQNIDGTKGDTATSNHLKHPNSFSSGNTYHYYGAMTATYFLGSNLGGTAVDMQTAKVKAEMENTQDSSAKQALEVKSLANSAGADAGKILRANESGMFQGINKEIQDTLKSTDLLPTYLQSKFDDIFNQSERKDHRPPPRNGPPPQGPNEKQPPPLDGQPKP